MADNKIGEFAIKHPFITMLIIGNLCSTLTTLVRGYPSAPIRDLNINTNGNDDDEEVENLEPVNNVTVEEV